MLCVFLVTFQQGSLIQMPLATRHVNSLSETGLGTGWVRGMSWFWPSTQAGTSGSVLPSMILFSKIGCKFTILCRIDWLLSCSLCSTLCDPMECSPPGSFIRGVFQAKNTRVGYPFFLQGIIPTPGWNPHLLNWQVDSLLLSHQESPWLLIVSVCVISHIGFLVTSWTDFCQDLLSVEFSMDRNAGVDWNFLLQGMFLTHGSNSSLLSAANSVFLKWYDVDQREHVYRQTSFLICTCIPQASSLWPLDSRHRKEIGGTTEAQYNQLFISLRQECIRSVV